MSIDKDIESIAEAVDRIKNDLTDKPHFETETRRDLTRLCFQVLDVCKVLRSLIMTVK